MRRTRLLLIPLLALVLVVGACSLPDARTMDGQLPIRIDKQSPIGVDFDCDLAMTQASLGSLAAIKNYLKDHEPERRQAITNFFTINPGPGVVQVIPGVQMQERAKPPDRWSTIIKYGLAGLTGLDLYTSCRDQLFQPQTIHYWCGVAERPYTGIAWPGLSEEAKIAMFYHSGWWVCDGRNPTLPTWGYAVSWLGWQFQPCCHGAAMAESEPPPFDPDAPLPAPPPETIPVPCVPMPPAYGPPGCIPGTGT